MQTFVDMVLSRVDLALELEPWQILARAKTHLANKPMDVGDERAWYELDNALQQLMRGRTASEYGNDEIRWPDGLQHY